MLRNCIHIMSDLYCFFVLTCAVDGKNAAFGCLQAIIFSYVLASTSECDPCSVNFMIIY